METPEVGDRVRVVSALCYEQGEAHGLNRFVQGMVGTILPCPNPTGYIDHIWRVRLDGSPGLIPQYFAASELELMPPTPQAAGPGAVGEQPR